MNLTEKVETWLLKKQFAAVAEMCFLWAGGNVEMYVKTLKKENSHYLSLDLFFFSSCIRKVVSPFSLLPCVQLSLCFLLFNYIVYL